MLKKIFFIVLLFNIINHCDYKPVYSKQNKTNLKFLISNFTGDKEINNLIVSNLKLNNRNDSKKIINISFDTIYSKNILAKNATGAVTDYQSNVKTTFIIENGNTSQSFLIKEKFNFQKMNDKYEERNYEKNIKKNLANLISQKLILRLAMIK